VTVQPHASRPPSHVTGCTGFWLWALVGAGLVFGLISFVILFLIPPVVLVVLLTRRSRWTEGRYLLGIVAGAGLPLVVVAALNWSEWHHRTIGDSTPNPYYWGAVGICLLVAGIAAYEIRSRRSS
jgi:hypothetical protein